MAHPTRRAQADSLLAALGLPGDELVLDPYPNEPTGALPPFVLACKKARPSAAPWHVVLMDDAIPTDGFWELLSVTLDDPPIGTVSLYHEWGSRTGAMARCGALGGCRFVPVVDPYVPTIGIALPATWALAFAETYPGRQTLFEDIALGRFLASRSQLAHASVPTLVQHRTMPSLVGHDDRGLRKSTLFAADSPVGAKMLADTTWTGRYAPYVRYHDLALHVLVTSDGRFWTKIGIEQWLHRHPQQRARLAALVNCVEPVLDELLLGVDTSFNQCRCIELSAQHIALLAMSVADAGGVRGPSDVAAAALETLLPGTLRLSHEVDRLRDLGYVLLELVVTAVGRAV